MIEVLTGTGLATAAGLNAYIPLLAVGVLSRYSSVIEMPPLAWLGNGWVLLVLGALLIVECVADKIPAVDHVNDMIQTVVRPLSAGLCFTAGAVTGTGQGPFGAEPGTAFGLGLAIGLIVHLLKATARSMVNTSTAGLGAPVVSTIEDLAAVTMTVLALLVPIGLLVVALGLGAAGTWLYLARRDRARPVYPL